MPTSRDYYTVLGVSQDASKDDIKRAFHKLARKYHPDNKETGDEQRFKEINEAYHMLADDKKRAEYDSYGHVFSSGAGGADFGGFSSGFGGARPDFGDVNIGDIFNEFFGGRERAGGVRRGRDISIDLEVSFKESIFGTERSVLIGKTVECNPCKGTGGDPGAGFSACKTCNGRGRIHESRSSFFGTFTSIRECGTCYGEGKVPEKKCAACSGVGILKQQEDVDVRVPQGIRDGEVIRLSGMGEAIPRGATGDLYIKIHVTPHPVFRREGANLVMDLQIKLSDALLGGDYTVETLDGSKVSLKTPAGISPNEVLRVRGKGVPVDEGRRGDLMIRININFPQRLSKRAREYIEKLRGEGI